MRKKRVRGEARREMVKAHKGLLHMAIILNKQRSKAISTGIVVYLVARYELYRSDSGLEAFLEPLGTKQKVVVKARTFSGFMQLSMPVADFDDSFAGWMGNTLKLNLEPSILEPSFTQEPRTYNFTEERWDEGRVLREIDKLVGYDKFLTLLERRAPKNASAFKLRQYREPIRSQTKVSNQHA